MSGRDHQFDGNITRRALVAGAAVGTLAATTDPAAAQRCGTPTRAKGPLVWLDLTSRISTTPTTKMFTPSMPKHRRAACRQQREGALGHRQARARRLWARRNRKVDIYKSKRPNAPIMLFIHGGGLAQWAFIRLRRQCEPFIKAGAHFVAIDFNNVIETGGDLFPMVDQCRARGRLGLSERPQASAAMPMRSISAAAFGQPSRRLRGHYRLAEARAAARYPQGCGAGQRHVRPQAGAAVEARKLRQVHR